MSSQLDAPSTVTAPAEDRPFVSPSGRIVGSAAVSSVGDGMTAVAIPLVVASLTGSALAIAAVRAIAYLPELVAPVIGALVDRVDRRRLVARLGLVQAYILAVLAVLAWRDVLAWWVVAVGALVLGACITAEEPASESLVADYVAEEQLDRVNGHVFAAYRVGERLVGQPLGGLAYALGAWLPFIADAVSFIASSILIRGLPPVEPANEPSDEPIRSVWLEVRTGLRWLWRSPLVRTMAFTVGLANLASSIWSAVLVLYATRVLHGGSISFGLLMSGQAIAAVAASLLAGRFGTRLSRVHVLSAAIVIQAAALPVLAVTTSLAVAIAALAVVGAGAATWNVVAVSLRQTVVPRSLYGRVAGAYRLIIVGVVPVGALLGGILAGQISIQSTFWVSAVLMVAVAIAMPIALHRQPGPTDA